MTSLTLPRLLGIEAHRVLMGALFIGALGLGALLLPGDAERIAMLERDGLEREAMQILEQRFAAGDRRHRTLFQLTRFYDRLGDVGKARNVREIMASQRPRDVAVLADLAQFYKQIEDIPAYTAATERLIDLKYSESACRDLVGIYRLNGAFAEERAALETCRQKGYRRPEDMVRLAQMFATDGDVAQASLLLRGVDDLRRLKSVRERLQLFAVLLDADQPREALRRGVRWTKGSRDDLFALTLVEMLLRAGKPDVAIELARDVSVPGDRVSLAVAEIMLDKNQPLAAQSYLRGWLDKARIGDVGVAVRFVEASLASDDAETAFKGARRFGLDKLPEADLVALAEALATIGKRAELDEVLPHVPAEAVSHSSVLTVAGVVPVEIVRPSKPVSEAAVASPAGDPLAAWRRALWARLNAENNRQAQTEAARRAGAERINPTVAKAKTVLREHRKAKRLRLKFKPKQSPAAATKAPAPIEPPQPGQSQ